MKKIFLFLSIAMLMLTSCSDDPKNEVILTTSLASRIVEQSTNEVVMKRNNVQISVDFIANTMNVIIANPRYTSAFESVSTMELKKLPFKATTTGYAVNETSIVPFINGSENTAFTMSNLYLNIYEGEITLNFNFNGYNIYSMAAESVYPYASTKVSTEGAADYINEKTFYIVRLAPTEKTATIVIRDAKFADKMPTFTDMTLKDAVLTPTATGYIIESASVIPSIGSTPYPDFVIKNLKAILNGTSMSLNFSCDYKGTVFQVSSIATMHEQKKP